MLLLVSTLYERNLFYQQLSFKWKTFVYLKNILAEVSSLGFVSLPKKALLVAVVSIVYLLDIFCGWLVYTVITENASFKQSLVRLVSSYTITMLVWTNQLILWIMGIPGGLKLNTPLNHFVGTRFLGILDLWQYFYSDFIALYLDLIIILLIYLLPFGLTLSLTALHDFLKFLHLCSICFFIFLSRIVGFQVSALKSLARLFMGTKWNILKKRVDSCEYDTNQLLVGTVLFTILLFLLPTTSVYFVIFLLLRLLQFGIQLMLRVAAVLLNKTTVGGWSYLSSILKDEPLTSIKMNIKYKDEVAGKPCDAQILWSGKEYTVDEIRSVLNSAPVDTISHQIRKCSTFVFCKTNCVSDNETITHPMLDLLGTLPKSFY